MNADSFQNLLFLRNTFHKIRDTSLAPLYICRESSTNQPLFMQNKPNFLFFSTKNKGYAQKQTQFKPNQSQYKAKIEPKTKPICFLFTVSCLLLFGILLDIILINRYNCMFKQLLLK